MDNPASIKRCGRCKESKDRSDFSRSGRSKASLQPWCRACYAAYQRGAGHSKRLQEAYKRRHDDAFYQLAYSGSRLKFCAGCGQTRSIEEFYKRRSGPDGFATYCRPCDVRMSERRVTVRSEEHTSELQSRQYLVCRLLLEKKKKTKIVTY